MNNDFVKLKIAPFLIEKLNNMNITEPTGIQMEAIPKIIQGENVIGRSKTGSGKTLAYLLPAITMLKQDDKNIQSLILAPTHELAMQIYRVLEELVSGSSIFIDVFIGSANIKRQIEKLKKQKPQIVVGTPGRVLELAQQKKLKLHQLSVVVVDEADRMLKENETRNSFIEVAKRIGKDSQYLFFSATISEQLTTNIEELIRKETTFISSDDHVESEIVKHYFIKCDERDRIDMARRLIHHEKIKKGILFVNHLDKVVETTEKLKYRGYKAAELSSDTSKHDRAKVIQQLQSGEINIIVASDVAARGLDINDITHIINIHPPVDHDAYVHRAGRTGRMGKSGIVFTIISHKEMFIIDKFEKKLNIRIEPYNF